MLTLQIFCITYNHEDFIAEALNSFTMQKTNFKFEVLIADDASTDKTPEIIKKFQQKFPEIIKPIFRKKNLGAMQNSKDLQKFITAPYVALCEGDDYWTDPLKLQKQVDMLEANLHCTICFHPVQVIWEDKSQETTIFPSSEFMFYKTTLNLNDLCKHNFMQTNSVVYRWINHNGKNDYLFPTDILPGDYYSHLAHAKFGDICYIDECMAVYRRWSGGMWHGAGESNEWFLKYAIKHLRFYKMKIALINDTPWQYISDMEKIFALLARTQQIYSAKKSNKLNIFLNEEFYSLTPKKHFFLYIYWVFKTKTLNFLKLLKRRIKKNVQDTNKS